MAFERVKPPKLADTIVHQMEGLILEGILKPGEKLPAERELAERLSVSRPSLREALQKLEAKGLLETRQGGGSYIKDILLEGFTNPLVELLRDHPESSRDLLEFRQALEGIAAYDAAERATEADREIIQRRFEAMQEAHGRSDPSAEAEADAQFHLSITEAAHNLVLLLVMRALFDLLRRGIVSYREKLYTKEGVRESLFSQHEALCGAVLQGDAKRARLVALDHLTFVDETLRAIEREQAREDRSQKRLRTLSG
jgi:GntR family transcriptional regulator, transcriptional repressor for pyruvate dehydrogenase complex